eukprot:EG_transcript_25326
MDCSCADTVKVLSAEVNVLAQRLASLDAEKSEIHRRLTALRTDLEAPIDGDLHEVLLAQESESPTAIENTETQCNQEAPASSSPTHDKEAEPSSTATDPSIAASATCTHAALTAEECVEELLVQEIETLKAQLALTEPLMQTLALSIQTLEIDTTSMAGIEGPTPAVPDGDDGWMDEAEELRKQLLAM